MPRCSLPANQKPCSSGRLADLLRSDRVYGEVAAGAPATRGSEGARLERRADRRRVTRVLRVARRAPQSRLSPALPVRGYVAFRSLRTRLLMGANKPGVVNRRRSPLRERFGHDDRRASSNLQYNPGRPGRPGARTRAVNDEGQFAHFLTVGSVAAWVLWAEHEYRGLTYCPWNTNGRRALAGHQVCSAARTSNWLTATRLSRVTM